MSVSNTSQTRRRGGGTTEQTRPQQGAAPVRSRERGTNPEPKLTGDARLDAALRASRAWAHTASVGKRLLAYTIDVAVVLILAAVAGVLTRSPLVGAVVALELGIVQCVIEARTGLTAGNACLRLRTVRDDAPRSPGIRAAAVRGLIMLGGFLVGGIGGWLMVATAGLDPRRAGRSWADRVGHTLVVAVPSRAELEYRASAPRDSWEQPVRPAATTPPPGIAPAQGTNLLQNQPAAATIQDASGAVALGAVASGAVASGAGAPRPVASGAVPPRAVPAPPRAGAQPETAVRAAESPSPAPMGAPAVSAPIVSTRGDRTPAATPPEAAASRGVVSPPPRPDARDAVPPASTQGAPPVSERRASAGRRSANGVAAPTPITLPSTQGVPVPDSAAIERDAAIRASASHASPAPGTARLNVAPVTPDTPAAAAAAPPQPGPEPTTPEASAPAEPAVREPADPPSGVVAVGNPVPRARIPRPREGELLLVFDTGQRVQLPIPVVAVLGRKPDRTSDQDQIVAIGDPEGTVSKTHLKVEYQRGSVWVTDLGSTNGTHIIDDDGDDAQLPAGGRALVAQGARVRIGNRVFTLSTIIAGGSDE
ncbi:RDD family protein [Mycetocola saprophilus]|uniref:RDD family protein n=1 Tax=Mycetocola saprophilus TaxID=76636 RepID=UPI0004BFF460|nr:RDD family protein [Mycetocola saprophilus]